MIAHIIPITKPVLRTTPRPRVFGRERVTPITDANHWAEVRRQRRHGCDPRRTCPQCSSVLPVFGGDECR